MGAQLCGFGFVDPFVAPEPCQSAVGALVETFPFVNTVIEMTSVGGHEFRSCSGIDDVRVGWIYCDGSEERVGQPFTARLPGQARVETTENSLVCRDVCDVWLARSKHHFVHAACSQPVVDGGPRDTTIVGAEHPHVLPGHQDDLGVSRF